MLHPDEPWDENAAQNIKDREGDKPPEVSELSSNDCKKVDEEMDENIKEKIDSYLELFR